MAYSKQEGYVAQLLVREKHFCVEESRAWQAIVSVNMGKPLMSIQIWRFLQLIKRAQIKVPREEKRYRTNGIMWIEENWDAVEPHIRMLSVISRELGPLGQCSSPYLGKKF
jgi:hypothetical protein